MRSMRNGHSLHGRRRITLNFRNFRSLEQLETKLLLAGDGLCGDRGGEAESSYVAGPWAGELLASNLAKRLLTYPDQVGAFDAGATLSTAQDVGVLNASRTFGGSVGGSDTGDFVRFTLQSQAQLSVALGSLTADIDLALYNHAGQRIGLSNKAGAASEAISQTLSPGVYYVGITPWRRAASSYALSLSATPLAPTPAPPTPPTTAPTPSNPTAPVTVLPDVPNYGGSNEWNLNAINAPEAWAQGYKGTGVVVAVVDTGVDINHPDLMSQIWVNADEIAGNGRDDDGNGYIDDVRGWDFASGDNNPDDQNGHGTHVAGSIAADDNGFGATGVAPDATIMPVRVLGASGSGTATAVAQGIRYAADNGADIINLSLGGSLSTAIQAAIQYAQSRDVLVVAAAGNDSAATPSYPARFSAALANVISVGAYASSGARASFSNRVGTSGAVQVDAPGAGVYSTYLDGGYGTMSGTSMATPQVAGLAALALSANSSLTATQLRTTIVNGANDAVTGSDARGGINAAMTVAMARAGVFSASAVRAAPTTPTVPTYRIVSSWWFGAATALENGGGSLPAARNAFVETVGADSYAELAHSASANAPVTPTPRQRAIVALSLAADWFRAADEEQGDEWLPCHLWDAWLDTAAIGT